MGALNSRWLRASAILRKQKFHTELHKNKQTLESGRRINAKKTQRRMTMLLGASFSTQPCSVPTENVDIDLVFHFFFLHSTATTQ